MVRFFADCSNISGGEILLSAEDTAHVRSLRLRPDERFVVCDGVGTDYICRLGEVRENRENCESSENRGNCEDRESTGEIDGKAQVSPAKGRRRNEERQRAKSNPKEKMSAAVAEIIESRPSEGEPSVKCSMFIALAKGERLEFAVQKSIELGAYEIILFPSERCISVPKDMDKKAVRLQKIALETAKQCGRGIVPGVQVFSSFEEALRQGAAADLKLFPYESERQLSLKDALEQSGDGVKSIAVITGPEGGFEPHEVERAVAGGFSIVTLGKRILRCETAPVAVLAAVMYHSGNLA
ncbi:MAG: 16S rRNA (uracil(1498)-N(3))-methyltransferase [Oscillospiraceae bacterium]|nr:16S rRNA (uracil(1498)-N(3))-methyltransferase [Oscillospiraceae bacterium]